MLALLLAALSLSTPAVLQSDQRPTCPGLDACRAAAVEAEARQDYEAFHDLAWRALQRGRPNDPDLMYLVARAQSLSGRPGDAIVMIRRLAQMGVATEAQTSEAFRRVRGLPAWPELEAALAAMSPKATVAEADVPAAREAKPAGSPTPSSSPAATPTSPKAAPGRAPATAAHPEPSDDSAPEAIGPGAEDALQLTRALPDPVGIAYDAVSRRFIVGDRALNKLVVVDAVFNRMTDMVAAKSAGFLGLRGFEIDRPRGDLWVANTSPQGEASIHKLQLISGRVLYTAALPEDVGRADVQDLALTPAGTLLVLDREGPRMLRLPAGSRSVDAPIELSLEGPTSIAPAGEDVAYLADRQGVARIQVQGGTLTRVEPADGVKLDGLSRIWFVKGSLVGVQAVGTATRIVRIRLDARGHRATRLEVLDADAGLVNPTMATLGAGELYYVTQRGQRSVVRKLTLR
jgi:hypothetical protein